MKRSRLNPAVTGGQLGSSHPDEQTSSDDEEAPDSKHGLSQPPAMHGSMYARIHEDVHMRLPSIDFSSAELDENIENEDVHVAGLVVSRSAEQTSGSEDFKAESQIETESMNEGHFIAIQEDLREQGKENSGTFLQIEPLNIANGAEENVSLIDNTILDHNSTGEPERLPVMANEEETESKIILGNRGLSQDTRNGIRTSLDIFSAKPESSYDEDVFKKMLDNNIDEENLDIILNALDYNRSPLNGPKSGTRISHSPNSSADESDNDLPLLDKLSSFTLNEKNSVSEADVLLGQLDVSDAGLQQIGAEKVSFISKSSKDAATSGQSSDQNNTVYLDLRHSETFEISKASSEPQQTQEGSSSGSEGEDWNQERRNIKAGLKRTEASSNENKASEGAATERRCFQSKIHDRMTRKTYEKLVKEGHIQETLEMKRSLNLPTNIRRTASNYQGDGIIEKAVFDIEPLEEKIRSWHQVKDSNGNDIATLTKEKPKRSMKDVKQSKEPVFLKHDCKLDHPRENAEHSTEFKHACENISGIANANDCKTVTEDTSLLRLENVKLEPEGNMQALLIVEGKDKMRDVGNESVKSSNSSSNFDVSLVDSKDEISLCCIEELPDKVRITDNLMVIKADISTKYPNDGEQFLVENIPLPKSDGESKPLVVAEKSCIELENCNDFLYNDAEQNSNVGVGSDDYRKDKCKVLSLEEVEKSLITKSNGIKDKSIMDNSIEGNKIVSDTRYSQKGSQDTDFGLEMKTYSVIEDCEEITNSDSCEEMVELGSTIRGLVPHYMARSHRAPFGWPVTDQRASSYQRTTEQRYSGEETPLIRRQGPAPKLSALDSNHRSDWKVDCGKPAEQLAKKENALDERKIDSLTKNCLNKVDNATNSKSKKKSKKKNRKSGESFDEKEQDQKSSGEKKKVLNQEYDSKSNSLKSSKSFDNEPKRMKKPVNGLKENERQQVKDRIKILQEEFGAANVIFDEDVSFSQPFQPLPTLNNDAQKLMLKVPLQAPGVCSKSCVKNSLTFDERSDAFVGLCTFFISLLRGSKFKPCESLGIPFDVIALEQASIDSELQLVVGIVENEVQAQPNQQLKRGKPMKSKKSFYQAVIQYINKTDLESVLSDLMGFEIVERQPSSPIYCPGTRKLSSYVTVSQDAAAVDRIFNLRPAMLWNEVEQNEEALSDDICWMKGEKRRNENTCVLVENITSMLPKTIATFFKTARNNSLDISGLRVTYIMRKGNKEVPFLAAALRGPNVTTVQSGKCFTGEDHELSSMKSVFMPSITSPCEGPREVTVSLRHGFKPFESSIEDPLITYTIGRGRGEREVVNWFGSRTRHLSDVDASLDRSMRAPESKSSSLPEKLDVLSRTQACASLLAVTNDHVVLSMSPLVPTIFISIAMTVAESRGLHTVCAGKILLSEDDVSIMGLKLEGSVKKGSELHSSVSLLVLEGENALYRIYGCLRQLFKHLNEKLPQDALTENGLVRYERIKQERFVNEFFAVKQPNKRIVKILEAMTTPHLCHFDHEVISSLPARWNFFSLPEIPRLATVIFVGSPTVEIVPYILQELFEECLEDPLCINAHATTEKKFRQQERPVGELIGLKYFETVTRHMAHVCCPFVVGAKSWMKAIEQLQNGPVVVIVLRLLDSIKNIDEKCKKICQYTSKLLHTNKLKSPPDSYHDAFIYTGLDTVFRVLLNMFKVDELMPDACHTWFHSTQWPIYLESCSVLQKIDPLIGLLKNANELKTFRHSKELARNVKQIPGIKILSPFSLNIPAELMLGKQSELTFIQFNVNCNYTKYIAKVLSILRRDAFDVVALNFPAAYYPSYDQVPEMHVVVRRPNAVSRLNQWLPDLTYELKDKHGVHVSRGAKEAFDAIVRSFQKTESGGVFDDSALARTEKLAFTSDDVFASREYRRLEWASPGLNHSKNGSGSNHGFVMPEVTVVILTNVMMRGSFLDQFISENVKMLGFWEELCSLGFKTIGARMTGLDEEQAKELLSKLDLPARQQRIMKKRLCLSNGPIFTLALLKDFALSNFWNTISRALKEDECKIIAENVLIPTNKMQVEILLHSMFETLAPNSEVEIKRIK